MCNRTAKIESRVEDEEEEGGGEEEERNKSFSHRQVKLWLWLAHYIALTNLIA